MPGSAPSLPRGAGEGEKYCPQCREIIRADAMKCRFCGKVLDSALVSNAPPAAVLSSINGEATSALVFGILGLIICGPIFGSMAISKGNSVFSQLDRYPLFQGGPRGRARAGQILGWIAWIFFVVAIFGRLATH